MPPLPIAATLRRLITAMLSTASLCAAWVPATATAAAMAAYAYGTAPLQQLDYARPTGNQSAPLIVLVHGGD